MTLATKTTPFQKNIDIRDVLRQLFLETHYGYLADQKNQTGMLHKSIA